MLDSLEQFSTLALYSAMVVYAMAFVFYAVDLANRSGDRSVTAGVSRARAPQLVAAGGAASDVVAKTVATTTTDETATATSTTTAQRRPAPEGAAQADRTPGGPASQKAATRSRSLRIGFSLTVLAFLLHAAATITRGIGAERVPFANMYEFALSATLAIVLIYVVVQFFVDLRFLGVLISGLVVLFLGIAKVNFYVDIVPLPPALDSYWLVIHIMVAVLAVGFLTLSFGLSVLQLMQTRRERTAKAEGGQGTPAFLASFPDSKRLEDLGYRMAIIGFVFWSFTLIAGSIWAEAAWSRYWGWDTKEVWTFVIWVLYAGFIHARATRGWRGTRSAWLSIVAYTAVIFNFTIVNVFFKGLHAYSGL